MPMEFDFMDKDSRIRELEQTIAYLERRMARLEQGWARQERINDNQRTLLRGVNAEYERALAKLGESEERFRRLAENSRDIIYRMSVPDGRYEYVSSAVERITGYAPHELYGHPSPVWEHFHQDCREFMQGVWEGIKLGTVPDSHEFRVIAKDGRDVWLSQRSCLVRDDSGRVAAIEGIIRDVSEWKEAERLLAESEERYRTLVRESPMPMVVHQDEILVYANPMALEIVCGSREASVVGRSVWDFVHPQHISASKSRMGALAATGRSVTDVVSSKLKRMDGTYFDVLIKSSVITYGGKPSVVTSFYDVSELKETEQRLRESEAMARILLNLPVNLNLLLDREYRVLDVNDAMAESLNISRDELRGKSIFDQLPPDLAASRKALAEQALATGRTVHFEDVNHGVNFDNVFTPVPGADGKPLMLAVTARDITDLKRAQEELEEARAELELRVMERTRDLAMARSRFYNLAMYQQERIEDERRRISREIHDELGQNLTAVRMGLFRLGRYADDPGAFRERLDYLTDLTAQAISSVQRITRELRPMHLDDMGLASAILALAREFEDIGGMIMDTHLEFDEKTLSKEEVTSLYRVVQESLTNAVRHSGGTRVDITIVGDGEGVELIIADDGRGIDEAVAQSPESFGLLGMRERVQYFGGMFEVRSGPEGGVEVWARFPGGK